MRRKILLTAFVFAVALFASAMGDALRHPAYAEEERECTSWGSGGVCGFVPGSCSIWGCEFSVVFRWYYPCVRPINGPACTMEE